MTVKLETTIKRYVGTSEDFKPGEQGFGDAPPAGSSFLETDTGRIYRYDGDHWTVFVPFDDQSMFLEAILHELHELRELQERFVAQAA